MDHFTTTVMKRKFVFRHFCFLFSQLNKLNINLLTSRWDYIIFRLLQNEGFHGEPILKSGPPSPPLPKLSERWHTSAQLVRYVMLVIFLNILANAWQLRSLCCFSCSYTQIILIIQLNITLREPYPFSLSQSEGHIFKHISPITSCNRLP